MLQDILVLPSERTLRQARNNNEGDKIGIQTQVVERIKNAIHHCTLESDRLAVLTFDEMAIKGNRCILCLFEKHATPNSWKKMNVAIAAQTMSETVGMIEAGIICD